MDMCVRSQRIGLDQLIDNPWVKIGLSRQRARVIAKVRWPEYLPSHIPSSVTSMCLFFGQGAFKKRALHT